MLANERSKRARAVALLFPALLCGACIEGTRADARDEGSAGSDESARSDEDDEAGQDGDRGAEEGADEGAPPSRGDAGSAPVDAGTKPVISLDAGAKPADGARDASIKQPPDAGRGPTAPQDGGASGLGRDGGVPGRADASTPAPGGALCARARYQAADRPPTIGDFPVLQVNGGVPVDGAGCAEQWEGIVMTMGGRGLCTAAFISDRHLISASHCYAADGPVSLRVSAPTWDDGASHTFQAQVKRSGGNQSLDVAIIDLGKPVEWAAAERRFVLHAGPASSVDLHLYGFGSGGSSGAAGTLRGIPNRATIRVSDNGRGNLRGTAGAAQLCTGDSGGPAFVEGTAPVLYGINQAIVPTSAGGGRTCASASWSILFTNVSAYLPFVEQALGTKCERKRVDGLEVAQCW